MTDTKRGKKKAICKCKNCGDRFIAREADVKRGWARFCSKACKAREQTRRGGYSGPNYIIGAALDEK